MSTLYCRTLHLLCLIIITFHVSLVFSALPKGSTVPSSSPSKRHNFPYVPPTHERKTGIVFSTLPKGIVRPPSSPSKGHHSPSDSSSPADRKIYSRDFDVKVIGELQD